MSAPVPNPPRKLSRRDFFQGLVGRRGGSDTKPAIDSWYKPSSPERVLLRPPGALPESEFLQTCLHCGNCVDSCPAEAIQTYVEDDEHLIGTPYIDPDRRPCVVCESLACMNACPSGALRMVELSDIDMGIAVWNEPRCVRSSGEDCVECVERCPLGSRAIALSEDDRIVVHQACVGCGVCQHYCPTDAIRVVPSGGSAVRQ